MAPHAETGREDEMDIIAPPSRPARSVNPPRVLIVGAGSRGNAYARETGEAANGIVVAVAEPITYKRQELGQRYIWGKGQPSEGQEFEDWKQYLAYETERRAKATRGESVPEGVDAVFICVLDEMHKEVILGLAPLGLHIMCEKPLTTNIDDCVAIYKSLLPDFPKTTTPQRVFSVGHVLRYSQHNIVLRKLLLEDKAIGEILSVEHTEPVGWWHFAHSFVRYVITRGMSRNI
jgi:predicted dehydrogenase